jgi:serine/threonine protein kinase
MAKEAEPQRFGKCLIEREIGRGARSVVYLAWHEGLQIPVAVKVMSRGGLGDEDQFAERFMREARIAAQLSHTNIVRVYDCGETEGSFYLVLEYIEGQSCKDRMGRSGPFDWPTAARIVRAVSDGLKYASTKGIIHRDLKPENIMIDKEGNARIADLGLAKEVRKGASSATAEGDVLGTPYYMSPEQVRQPGDVDFRSDIYSLGATLYHMVTGEVPFEAPTPFEIMTMHLNEPVTPPQVRNPNLPRELCDIIMRAMAKEPQSRYQSYGDLIRRPSPRARSS